jgi:ribose transport system substrate-binding protein
MGVDCLMEAVQAVVDGRYDATTANDPQFLGTLAVRVSAKVAAGEEVPDYVDAGSILITQENAQEFLNPDLVFCAYAPEVEY